LFDWALSKILLGVISGENANFNQKSICRLDRQFEVLVTDVEVEKTVIGAFEIDELAFVSPETQATTELFNLIEWSDAIGFPMKHQHGWQFAPN
jgi:hypothetical protein